jgi:hypothetical protein
MGYFSIDIELNEEMKIIEKEFIKYAKLFNDIYNSSVGKYTINYILESVEKFLEYLQISKPIIQKWVNEYLEENRGKLWLYYGMCRANYLTDYWNIGETNFKELGETWPFLFSRFTSEYKGFIIDLKDAQNDIIRQRKRQDTVNPNYTPFHPDGCPGSGCCCFMLDDMEQWHKEELSEVDNSKNIFFNDKLQKDFYKIAVNDLNELRNQWLNWEPDRGKILELNSELKIVNGSTPIKIVIAWIKHDFSYSSIVSMFSYMDIFDNIWKKINYVDIFIECQRDKLKKIREIIY